VAPQCDDLEHDGRAILSRMALQAEILTLRNQLNEAA
jgi:hypothetical protein